MNYLTPKQKAFSYYFNSICQGQMPDAMNAFNAGWEACELEKGTREKKEAKPIGSWWHKEKLPVVFGE